MIPVATLALLPLLAAFAPGIEYPDTPEGLKKLTEDLLAAVKAGDKDKSGALVRSLALPRSAAWFTKIFGDDAGARLETEYQALLPDLVKQLTALYSRCIDMGQTEVRAIRIENAGDAATGLQNSAFEAMKTPVALYTVKLVKPGDDLGMALWSFAHVDGSFRLIGKLRAVKPPGK